MTSFRTVSRSQSIARLLIVAAVLWVYISAIVAIRSSDGSGVVFPRLDLLAVSGLLTAGLWGMRAVSVRVGPGAFERAAASGAFIAFISTVSVWAPSTGLLLAVLGGVAFGIGIFAASFVVSRIPPTPAGRL